MDDSDGIKRGHYESGEIQWECELRDGERHGTLRFWFEDGMLQSQREYLHGMKHGPVRDCHPDGRMAFEGEYRADEVVEVREWDRDGNELPDALARWQEAAARAEAVATGPGSEILDPDWQARQAELGEAFLALWVVSWDEKRGLVQELPELADRTRHLVVRAVIARAGASAEMATLGEAHQLLIDRLHDAIAAAGDAYADAIDQVFADPALRAEISARTGRD